MRPAYRTVLLVLFCVALGFGLGNIVSSPSAEAQEGARRGGARNVYQISSFAGTAGGSVSHGAYVVDTMSGKVWIVRDGGEPKIVAEKLP
jgi:hypothetical protein